MNALLYNVRSLINREKRLEFADFVLRHNYDLILLTETWLTRNIKNSEFFLTHYNIIRADRPTVNKSETSKHGGCLIAIEKSLPYLELNLNGLPERLQELLLIVKLEQVAPLHIALLYNPQRGSPY